MNKKIKPIAIYLPQYHPIPENDAAWGKGFTEWTNVKKAKPLFEGHYQPHIPHEDVGYYDLRDPEVLVRQAAMANEYGIYGFAFYHYWFNGKRLLNLPLDNMLKLGKPDFPFLYIWANENWTKRWDGLDEDVIIKQEYSHEDDLNHIRWLCENVFCDKRYITIDGKPVFVVYRTELFPDIKKTVEIWRNEVKKYGFEGIYLIRTESLATHTDYNINPKDINFDAAMEFAPDNATGAKVYPIFKNEILICKKFDYREKIANMLEKKYSYKAFRCVFPSWDNSPRKKNNATSYINNPAKLFGYFVNRSVNYTARNFTNDEKIFFINAWNEWGEGCHIEPDKKNGYAYLNAIKNAISSDETFNVPLMEYCEFLEKDRQEIRLTLKTVQTQLINIQHSKSYRLGKFLLKPLHWIKKWKI
jgi:lipopolysaccharide biosynthesis protein